jgi:hypothetical protein
MLELGDLSGNCTANVGGRRRRDGWRNCSRSAASWRARWATRPRGGPPRAAVTHFDNSTDAAPMIAARR